MLSLLAAAPQTGQTAPDFALPMLEGGKLQLHQFASSGPVVLVVLRGFPGYQCPLCNRQFQDFLAHAGQFKAAGLRVVFVYPGPPDNLNDKASEFINSRTIPGHFHVLLDPDYKFTNAYQLRWDAPKETAYPSTFLLDITGKIHFAKVSNSHGGRTTATEVLAEAAKHFHGTN